MHPACPTSTPATACPSTRPTDGPKQSIAVPLGLHSKARALQTTPACPSARAPRRRFHGLFPVAGHQSSTPTTRYPGRRRSAAPGLAAGRPASFGTGRCNARWHRRTTGFCRCPLTPHEAEGPTNGGQCGFGAEGLPPTLACGVWTAHQTVDDLRRPLQCPEMMIAMIANVQGQFANRTCAVLDIEMYALEDSPSRPTIRHGRAILVLKSIDV